MVWVGKHAATCDLRGVCECGGHCYPLRGMSWLICSMVLAEDKRAAEEIDRRASVGHHAAHASHTLVQMPDKAGFFVCSLQGDLLGWVPYGAIGWAPRPNSRDQEALEAQWTKANGTARP